ncbi:MAG: hypothetical protein RQ783_00860 [Gammaproteobacteria bacterium]|nr:hypothetical protein [Gammaproteobacteria bacterium]
MATSDETFRHCEHSEAIQSLIHATNWIATAYRPRNNECGRMATSE